MIHINRRKMVLRVISFLLCLFMLPAGPAFALTQPEDTQAAALRELGIFFEKKDFDTANLSQK